MSSILNFPPIINGYQILWLSAVMIPLLSLSVMFIPNDPKIMTYMPGITIKLLIRIISEEYLSFQRKMAYF
jgi:hypothetical protein